MNATTCLRWLQRELLAVDELREAIDALVAVDIRQLPLGGPLGDFLDVVDYAGDNWLRCWFLGIDPETVKLTVPKKLEAFAV